MRMALLLSVLLCATAYAGDEDGPREKVEKQVEGLKKAAEKEARSSSPEGCKELLAESRVACGEFFSRGLKVNCFMMTTALGMAAKQAKGQLFTTGDDGKDVRAANASCRVHLRSLRRARDKATNLTDAAQAPEACQQLATEIDTGCFAGLEKNGRLDNGCAYVIRSTMSPALKVQCEGLLQALQSLKGQGGGR